MSETLQEQTEYRYHLTLARFDPEVEAGGFCHLYGTITNIGRNALNFAAEHNLRIGVRIYPLSALEGDGVVPATAPLIDTRGVVQKPLLLTEEQASFEIRITTAFLEPGEYIGVLDLVVEHAYWLADLGQKPYWFRFRCIAPKVWPQYRYRLDLAPFDLDAEVDSVLRLRGTITNTGRNALNFATEQDVRVGARIYPANAVSGDSAEPLPSPLLDVRGSVLKPLLLANEQTPFEIQIPTAALDPGEYVGVLDLVIEFAFWFADLGQKPYWFRFRCADTGGRAKFRYRLNLAHYDPDIEAGSYLLLQGTITNVGANVLNFAADADDQVRLGARVYQVAESGEIRDLLGQEPLAWARGTVAATRLATDQSAPFEIEVPTFALESGRYVAVLDLVVENVFWFADLGQEPFGFAFRIESDRRLTWALLSDLAKEQASQALHADDDDAETARDLELLSAVAAEFDFSGHPLVLSLKTRRAEPKWPEDDIFLNPAALGTHRAFQILNGLETSPYLSKAVPISRFMLHLYFALRPSHRWNLRQSSNLFEFIKWYLFEAPSLVSCELPIPNELRLYLNSSACDPWLSPISLSRLLFSVLFDGKVSVNTRKLADPVELGLLWVEYLQSKRCRTTGLVPDHLKASLMVNDALSQKTGIPITEFFARLSAIEPRYRARFDLANPAHRIAFGFEIILTYLTDPVVGPLISNAMRKYFKQHIGARQQNLSRLEFLLAGAVGTAELGKEDLRAWQSPAVREWFKNRVSAQYPEFAEFSSLQDPAPQAEISNPPALVIAGFPQTVAGLGENLRMSVRAFSRLDISPVIFDVESRIWDKPYASPVSLKGLSLTRDVTLFHLNAESIPQALLATRSKRVADSYKIGFLLWELEELPQAHMLGVELLDEIWVPSEFVREAYAKHCTCPVLNMGKGIELPDSVTPLERARLGIAEDSFCFLLCCDLGAGLARKNFLAAVRAFQAAFPSAHERVNLIIKTTDYAKIEWGDCEAQLREIRKIAQFDERIRIIAETVRFETLLALIATCDCLVSPHRAEGFGYFPAYALALSRPVIGTDYSGTRDFCDEETAYPVRWSPSPIEEGQFLFCPEGSFWAEIDEKHLAERMREVVADPAEARRRAAQGAERMRTLYSMEKLVARYRRRLFELGLVVRNGAA